MIEAVVFDWGGTLVEIRYDVEIARAGHEAGLEALRARGVSGLPEPDALARGFSEICLPELLAPRSDEVDYVVMMCALLRGLGAVVDEELALIFVEAEHRVWRPAHNGATKALPLLDAVAERGLLLGLLSNAFDPPHLAHAELERVGVASRLDTALFSAEVGVRKPHPAGFLRIASTLDLDPANILFVGDRLREDVAGAAGVGMRTALATWYTTDAGDCRVRPDAIIATHEELLALIDRMRAPA